MFKIWISWGVDAGNWLIAAKVPHVKDIQRKVIAEKLRSLNIKLSESGRADFSAQGLTPESLTFILKECAKNGYMLWQKRPPDTEGYYISVQPDSYVTKYCDDVTESYLALLDESSQ